MVNYNAAAAYLPHDTPMVLLDEVVSVDDDSACCLARVGADGALAPFLDRRGELPGWFGIEIIAQTVGVWSGWHGRQLSDTKPEPGMLLGARGYRCQQPCFPAGAELTVSITLLMRDEKIGSFEGLITINGERWASGRLNTWQPSRQQLQQLLQQGKNR
ncbi:MULTISPECIES: hotdog family protein [Erwinia]|uniref:Hotdog family protein n=1 Tax=Erwinia papayae TaxID=206499 RepID=A0ABV3MW40_9GAMM|nr:hotdog family protein [Erwinia mallotivora]